MLRNILTNIVNGEKEQYIKPPFTVNFQIGKESFRLSVREKFMLLYKISEDEDDEVILTYMFERSK